MPIDIDPVRAVVMDDPSTVYAPLVEARSLVRSEVHDLWVAAGPGLVSEALTHPDLGVRPPDTPVPLALVDTTAGDLFGRLARMTDGETQRRTHAALVAALDAVDLNALRAWTRQWAMVLIDTVGVDEAARAVAVQAVGHLLGVAERDLHDLTARVRCLVRGIAATASDADIAGAIDAAPWLVREIAALVDAGDTPLVRDLATAFVASGLDDREVIVANAIGLLIQAYDATWGLIANALLTARNEEVDAEGDALAQWVAQAVVPVQNTRRWAHRDTVVGGQAVRRGDAVLVVLATSGGDGVESLPFGFGRHACPGRAIAEAVAGAALGPLARCPWVGGQTGWEPSGNVRIPRLGGERSDG